MTIDTSDPRDPSDILVEEGIHPHPGPWQGTTRKSTRLSLGKWLAFAIMCIGAGGANACDIDDGRTNCSGSEYLKRCGNTSYAGMTSYNGCSLTAARIYPHRPPGVTLNGNNRCMVEMTAKKEDVPKAGLDIMDREAHGNKLMATSCTRTWDAMAYESDDDACYQATEDDVPPWECGPGCFLGGNIAFTACVMVLSWTRRGKPNNLWPRGPRRTIIIMKAKRTGQGQPRQKDERLRRMACHRRRIALRMINASMCQGSQRSVTTFDQWLQSETQPTKGCPGGEPGCELPRVSMERCPHHSPGKVREDAHGRQETWSGKEEQRDRALSALRGRTPRVR